MKRIALTLALLALTAVAQATTILYLEMRESPTGPGDVGIFIRVEVTDKADALAKRTQYAPLFGSKSHRDTLHTHNSDAPCVEEVLE